MITADEKILKVIYRHFKFPSEGISTDDTWHDLGADDLDQVELWMVLEEVFDIGIEEDRWDRCKTIGDVVKLVKSLLPT